VTSPGDALAIKGDSEGSEMDCRAEAIAIEKAMMPSATTEATIRATFILPLPSGRNPMAEAIDH